MNFSIKKKSQSLYWKYWPVITIIIFSFSHSTFLYLKFLVVWALVLLADFVLEFRFEYLWPFWLFIRSVYDSFRYQGLVSRTQNYCPFVGKSCNVSRHILCYTTNPMALLVVLTRGGIFKGLGDLGPSLFTLTFCFICGKWRWNTQLSNFHQRKILFEFLRAVNWFRSPYNRFFCMIKRSPAWL